MFGCRCAARQARPCCPKANNLARFARRDPLRHRGGFAGSGGAPIVDGAAADAGGRSNPPPGSNLANRLTNVPGASVVFLGGAVTYSNQAKQEMLGVSAETLCQHGAVSQPVAQGMAEGVRRRLHSDYALALTGIAGPGGGSPEKPVGTGLYRISWKSGHGCPTFLRSNRPGDVQIRRHPTRFGHVAPSLGEVICGGVVVRLRIGRRIDRLGALYRWLWRRRIGVAAHGGQNGAG